MTKPILEPLDQEKYEEYWKLAKQCNSIEDITAKDGPLSFLFKDILERLLKEELTDHLGYSHNDARSKDTDNSRNGFFKKNVKSESGTMEVFVPRDRDGSFSPHILPKGKTKSGDLEKKVISMYTKGMTTTDIAEHLSDLYHGAEVSPQFISQTTEKILPMAKRISSICSKIAKKI